MKFDALHTDMRGSNRARTLRLPTKNAKVGSFWALLFWRYGSASFIRSRFVADWTRNELVSYYVPSEPPTAMLSVRYGLTRALVVHTPVVKAWIPPSLNGQP